MKAMNRRVSALEGKLQSMTVDRNRGDAQRLLRLARLYLRITNYENPLQPDEEERQAKQIVEEWAKMPTDKHNSRLSPELQAKLDEMYGPDPCSD